MKKELTPALLREAATFLLPGKDPLTASSWFMCHAVYQAAGGTYGGEDPRRSKEDFHDHWAWRAFYRLLQKHGVSTGGWLDYRGSEEESLAIPREDRQDIRFMFLHLLAESMG